MLPRSWAAATERAEVTIERLIREADEIQRLATAAGQHSAANGALIAKAKLAGLWVEKTNNTNTNRYVDPNSLSDAELAAVISGEPIDVEDGKPSTPRMGARGTREKVMARNKNRVLRSSRTASTSRLSLCARTARS